MDSFSVDSPVSVKRSGHWFTGTIRQVNVETRKRKVSNTRSEIDFDMVEVVASYEVELTLTGMNGQEVTTRATVPPGAVRRS